MTKQQLSPTAIVMMTRRSWTHILAVVISDLHDQIEDRDNTFDPEEKKELQDCIKETIQKVLPILFLACDKTEFPEIAEEYKKIQRHAGIVVPEVNEDLAKQIVNIFPREHDE